MSNAKEMIDAVISGQDAGSVVVESSKRTWGNPSKAPHKGQFYAEYDDEASQWSVFHTDTGSTMYRCDGTKHGAKEIANEYNKKYRR